MSRVLAGPFLHTIWRPKVTGAEHVPASGGAILAANHQSVVDSVFLPLMMDRPVTFSAKAEYFTASGPAARLRAAGHPGGHPRHPAGAAPGPRGAAPRPDRAADRRPSGVPRVGYRRPARQG